MGNSCCYNERIKKIKADKSYHQKLAAYNKRGVSKAGPKKITDLEIDLTN